MNDFRISSSSHRRGFSRGRAEGKEFEAVPAQNLQDCLRFIQGDLDTGPPFIDFCRQKTESVEKTIHVGGAFAGLAISYSNYSRRWLTAGHSWETAGLQG